MPKRDTFEGTKTQFKAAELKKQKVRKPVSSSPKLKIYNFYLMEEIFYFRKGKFTTGNSRSVNTKILTKIIIINP